jgi:hypothetical protein
MWVQSMQSYWESRIIYISPRPKVNDLIRSSKSTIFVAATREPGHTLLIYYADTTLIEMATFDKEFMRHVM